MREDDEVVGQSGVGHGGKAVEHVGSWDPLRVGFVLDPASAPAAE